jgi:hypothetical protein
MFESESWYARLRWKIVMDINLTKVGRDLHDFDGGTAERAQRRTRSVEKL